MVMAQNSNTQYVAHEFVRQYYTMLHKDPSQLHRFYTKESQLTHGGSPNAKSEEPACGQEAIYEKIAQLSFHNCYAKIRSVDSHSTLGGGVVIQVNGELSNSGMAMRKFMQTFVLAQQEPKKYHVFNDIFRYQDETFEDTENDETVDGTVESENGYHYESTQGQIDHLSDKQEAPDTKVTETENVVDPYGYSNHVDQDKSSDDDDGDGFKEDQEGPVEEEPRNEVIQEQNYHENVEANDQEVPVETLENHGLEDKQEESEAANADTEEVEEVVENEAPVQEPEEPSKPFTWAALAKKNTPAPPANTTPQPKPQVKKPSPAPVQKSAPKKREENQGPPKKEQSDDNKRRNLAPDNHQIFIGNLPGNVTEKDVREAFGEFGNIVEVRLNPKNFGFIAFDSPDAPVKILNKTKTILIHNNTINTEVKRSVSGGGRGSGGGSGGGGFRRGGSDKEGRDRRPDNKNNRNSGQNRGGKSNSFGQKQRNDDGKSDNKNKEKSSREQRSARR